MYMSLQNLVLSSSAPFRLFDEIETTNYKVKIIFLLNPFIIELIVPKLKMHV